jgi:hypothetical protein
MRGLLNESWNKKLSLLRQHYDRWVRLGLSEDEGEFSKQQNEDKARCRMQGITGFDIDISHRDSGVKLELVHPECFKKNNHDVYQMWSKQGNVNNRRIAKTDMESYFMNYSDDEKRRPQNPENRFKVYCAVSKVLEEVLFFSCDKEKTVALPQSKLIDRYINGEEVSAVRAILHKGLAGMESSKQNEFLFVLASYFQGFLSGLLELSDTQALFKSSSKAFISIAYVQMLGADYTLSLTERYIQLSKQLDHFERYELSEDQMKKSDHYDAVKPLLEGLEMMFSHVVENGADRMCRVQLLLTGYKYNSFDSQDETIDHLLEALLGVGSLFPSFALWKRGSSIHDDKIEYIKMMYDDSIFTPYYQEAALHCDAKAALDSDEEVIRDGEHPSHDTASSMLRNNEDNVTQSSLRIDTSIAKRGDDFSSKTSFGTSTFSPDSVAFFSGKFGEDPKLSMLTREQYIFEAVRAFKSISKGSENFHAMVCLEKSAKTNVRKARAAKEMYTYNDFTVKFSPFISSCKNANYNMDNLSQNYGFDGYFSVWSTFGYTTKVTAREAKEHFGYYFDDEFYRPQMPQNRVDSLHHVLMVFSSLIHAANNSVLNDANLWNQRALGLDLSAVNDKVKTALSGGGESDALPLTIDQLHAVLWYFYKFLEKVLDVSLFHSLLTMEDNLITGKVNPCRIRISALLLLTIDVPSLCDLLDQYIKLLQDLEKVNHKKFPFSRSVSTLFPLLRALDGFSRYVLEKPEMTSRFSSVLSMDKQSHVLESLSSVMDPLLGAGSPAGKSLSQLLSCGLFPSFSLWDSKFKGLLAYRGFSKPSENSTLDLTLPGHDSVILKHNKRPLTVSTETLQSPEVIHVPFKKRKGTEEGYGLVSLASSQYFFDVEKPSSTEEDRLANEGEVVSVKGKTSIQLMQGIQKSHNDILSCLLNASIFKRTQPASQTQQDQSNSHSAR